MFNKVILVGNLTRDIEMRYANSGAAIGNSGIAVNRRYNVNGERREDVCFIDVTFFGRTAEVANQYLKKGSQLLIEGRLQYDTWQDKNTGVNRSKHSIVVESMQMLGGGNSNSGYGNQQNYGNSSYESSNYQPNRPNYQQNQQSSNQGGYKQNQKQQDSSFDDYSDNIPNIDIDDIDELPF